MKRLCALILLSCLLLTGCGGDKVKESYQKFADGLNARTDLRFTADIRAEYEDKSCAFTLQYSEDSRGCTVEVLSPELIKGVRARLEDGSSSLEYSGVMLETGELAQDVGSVLYGGEAVSCGLIDQLGSLGDALSCLHEMIDQQKKE